MTDVARVAGVSQTTVSLVMNDAPHVSIPAATRERIWSAVRELGYRPNALAAGLRRGASRVIGFLTDAIATTPFAGDVVRGAQEAAWRQGHILLIVNTDMRPDVEEEAVAMMLEHRVSGIVYSTWYHRAVTPPPTAGNVPLVFVNCYPADGGSPAVVPDEEQGGRLATEMLIARGHRRIGFLNSVPISREALGTAHDGRTPEPAPATTARHRGYRAALNGAGIEYDPSLVQEIEPDQEGGFAGASFLLSKPNRPTAIFCYNDRVAMGAYAAIFERGLRVPDDVAVVGFDNQEIIAAHLRPPLATIALPHREMGRRGIELLLGAVRQPGTPTRREVVPCPYVERPSA